VSTHIGDQTSVVAAEDVVAVTGNRFVDRVFQGFWQVAGDAGEAPRAWQLRHCGGEGIKALVNLTVGNHEIGFKVDERQVQGGVERLAKRALRGGIVELLRAVVPQHETEEGRAEHTCAVKHDQVFACELMVKRAGKSGGLHGGSVAQVLQRRERV